MTVNDLYRLCEEEIKLGNGNRSIIVADDEEGNGYHDLFYPFLHDTEMIKQILECSNTSYGQICTTDPKCLIILG